MNINRTLGYLFVALVFYANSALAQDEFGSSSEGMDEGTGQDEFGSSSEGMGEETGQDEFESSSEGTGEEMGQPEPAADQSNKPISLGLLIGYGIDFEEGDLNPFGFGFGLRGGYTLDFGLYLGAQFIYFLGDSVDDLGGEMSINVIPIGIEAGYDIQLDPIVIRPSLGLGIALAIASMDIMGVDESETETEFYIAPGASVIYPISGFFIGADLRFLLIFSDPGLEGLTIMANAGINL